MKHLRSTAIIMSILLTALTGILLAQEAAQAAQDTSRLAEPQEKRLNDVQPPELVMDILGIRPGLIIGEVGAGHGRVTVHLAARVGEKGKIYANDIDPEAVDYLKARCLRQGLTNVEPILSLPDDARFPLNSLDLAVMFWVYHWVDNPAPLLKSLLSSLKPWGFVVLVEPKPAQHGPEGKVLTRESVGDEARAAGFALDAVIEDRLQADNIFVLRPVVSDAPESHDRQKVRALWLDYLEWTKTAQGRTSPRDYAVSLDAKGVPGPEVRRRLHVLRGQFTEQPEGIEMIYDPLYGKLLTGDLEKDGFKTSPNAFLVEAMKGIKPGGQALDVGAGMGRNAIHLAGLGWDVTGIDLSARGLAVMQANAEKAGLKVRTVKTSYEDFDFGRERWDLVAMILSWAPVEEAGFLARLKESIRPGGHVVFEHVVQRSENPFPPGVHALAPGALREFFRDFEILIYRELDDYGDWGGPPTAHVRMVARKQEKAFDGEEIQKVPGPKVLDEGIHARIDKKAESIFSSLVDLRRNFHQHPELSGQEQRTSGLIRDYLMNLGLEVKTNIGGCGVLGILKGAKPGPVVAWRADMDALASDTPESVEFKSLNKGIRHACGHDVHTAIGLGIANVLSSMKEALSGTVLFVFQPAEEIFSGAKAMIDAGLFGKLKPEAVFALHLGPMPVGVVIVKQKEMFACRVKINIDLKNITNEEEALNTCAGVLKELDTPGGIDIFSVPLDDGEKRIFNPQGLLTNYFVLGGAPNIERQEDHVHAVGVRAFASSLSMVESTVGKLKEALNDSQMKGSVNRVDYSFLQPVVNNDPGLTAKSVDILQAIYGKNSVMPLYGVIPNFNDDFAFFQKETRGVYFFLGGSNFKEGVVSMPHTPDFAVDEECINKGVAYFSSLLFELTRAPLGE